MSKFTKVFSLPNNLYTTDCPVIITANALQKNNQTEEVFIQLKFENIKEKTIKALTAEFETFDITNNMIDKSFKYQYLDCNAGLNVEFGQKILVDLKNPKVRSFNVKITEIIFSDNSFWNGDKVLEPYPQPQKLEETLGEELAEQYKRDIGKSATYEPSECNGLWCCTCGSINRIDESFCHSCRIDKIKQFKYLDHNVLSTNKQNNDKKDEISKTKNRINEIKGTIAATNTTGKYKFNGCGIFFLVVGIIMLSMCGIGMSIITSDGSSFLDENWWILLVAAVEIIIGIFVGRLGKPTAGQVAANIEKVKKLKAEKEELEKKLAELEK